MKVRKKADHFYGWIALIGTMFTYAGLCGDITYAYGLFLPSMGENFHWNRSTLSAPYVLFFIIGGLLGPVSGLSIARFGARKNIVIFNSLAAIGLLGLSQVSAAWHVFLFFGVLCGMGIAFGEFIPITTIINNWFIKKRSLAMGLLFASGGFGGFAMPPLISFIISDWGWRMAWACLAGIHILLTVIIGATLIRNRPEEIGQQPDGIPRGISSVHLDLLTVSKRVYQTSKDWTVQEALRTPALWMITLLFSLVLFASAMLTTHQVAYLQDLNFSPIQSSTALGLMIGMSVIGRLGCGFLAMRYDGRYLAAFFLTGMGLGLLALMIARGMIYIYLYSILSGIGFGGMIVLMPNFISAYFGRTHYSQIVGWTSPVVTLFSAGSPSLAGFLFDVTGSYQLPWAIALGLLLTGIVVAILTRPPLREAEGV